MKRYVRRSYLYILPAILLALSLALGVLAQYGHAGATPLRDAERRACASPAACTPIQHIIIMDKENRTFDTMFGTFPGANGAAIAAKPGYPTVIVPFGMAPNAPTPTFPASFDAKLSPFGVSFTGMACSEPRLIELGFAFEQATKRRVALTCRL